MKNILILEDDKSLLEGVSQCLERDGYNTCKAMDLSNARTLLSQNSISLAILDLNLPDGDGILLCKEIRKTSEMPIIILTARDLEEDEINSIESGADDYISKPFSISVLITRVKSLFRRSDNELLSNKLESGNIVLNLDKAKLFIAGNEVEVSPVEYKLIKYFMENKEQLLLKEQILKKIWDNRGIFVDDNTLSVNIRRIRQKIEKEPSKPEYIKTVRGMGYIWHI